MYTFLLSNVFCFYLLALGDRKRSTIVLQAPNYIFVGRKHDSRSRCLSSTPSESLATHD